jgi:predicted  nucleic acid-binding Zn-ribbon protein
MADMNLIQAADEVRKMLRGFKAIDMVATALEQAGSVQNAVKESESALAKLRAEIAVAGEEFIAATTAVASAKEDAKKIKADAVAKADDKIAKAGNDAAAILASADSAVAEANEKVSIAEARIALLNDGVRNATVELEAIEKKIAAAKKQVATILG